MLEINEVNQVEHDTNHNANNFFPSYVGRSRIPQECVNSKEGGGVPTYCLAISPKNCVPGADPFEPSLVWYKIKQLFKINPRFVYSCLPRPLPPARLCAWHAFKEETLWW